MTSQFEDVVRLITIAYALGVERQIIPMLLPTGMQIVEASRMLVNLVEEKQREDALHKSKNS